MYPYHKITNIHILLLLVTYIDIVCIPNNTMVVLLYFDINQSVSVNYGLSFSAQHSLALECLNHAVSQIPWIMSIAQRN